MCYGAPKTVAELIEQLKLLPPQFRVVCTEGRSYGDPEATIVEPGILFDCMITFDQRTVVIA